MNIISVIKKNTYTILLFISVFLYTDINTKNNSDVSIQIQSLLNALEILASDNNATIVKDLQELFELLNVQSAREAINYINQMHRDIESLMSALGALDIEQALTNAQQYKSVFDQVLMLKDTIRPNAK